MEFIHLGYEAVLLICIKGKLYVNIDNPDSKTFLSAPKILKPQEFSSILQG